MRIDVIGEDESSNAQARTYAEYKVFAALAQHTQHVRGARVVLRRDKRNGTCESVAWCLPAPFAHARADRTRMRQLTVRWHASATSCAGEQPERGFALQALG